MQEDESRPTVSDLFRFLLLSITVLVIYLAILAIHLYVWHLVLGDGPHPNSAILLPVASLLCHVLILEFIKRCRAVRGFREFIASNPSIQPQYAEVHYVRELNPGPGETVYFDYGTVYFGNKKLHFRNRWGFVAIQKICLSMNPYFKKVYCPFVPPSGVGL